MSLTRRLLLLVALAAPRIALAQDPSAAAEKARLHVGPVAINPSFGLSNVGVDTNVFNDSDADGPKRDFTLTLTPAGQAWYRIGPVWLTGNAKEDLVYYRTYSGERSANLFSDAAVIVPLNRLTFEVGGGFIDTRDRPGFEIDARSQRIETRLNGSLEYRVLAKTHVGARGARVKIDFDKAAVFLGDSLQFDLNRTETTGAVTVRHALTPLTTLTVDLAREEDRFEFSPVRDSNSTRITGGVKFDPFALIKGTATVGFRQFSPLSPSVPGYAGLTAAVNLSYVALGTTAIGLQANRDVQYSFELERPYYVQTGGLGSLQQHVFGPFDLAARIGVQRLDYQNRIVATPSTLPSRTDYVRQYGGSVIYRLGADVRLGFNLDQQRRSSIEQGRQYNGLRFGSSVIYGL